MLKAVHTIAGMEPGSALTLLGRRNCPAAQAAAAHLFLTLSSVLPSLTGTPAALRRRCISGCDSRPSAVTLSASRRARTRPLGPGRGGGGPPAPPPPAPPPAPPAIGYGGPEAIGYVSTWSSMRFACVFAAPPPGRLKSLRR